MVLSNGDGGRERERSSYLTGLVGLSIALKGMNSCPMDVLFVVPVEENGVVLFDVDDRG